MDDILSDATASLSLSADFTRLDSRPVSILGDALTSDLPVETQKLTIPAVPPSSLTLHQIDGSVPPKVSAELLSSFCLPAAQSPVFEGSLRSLDRLTSGDAKVVYCATVELSGIERIEYKPGDSVAILCANGRADVDWLLTRTILQPIAGADRAFVVEPAGSKPVPQWLLPGIPVTARFLLTYCCELHIPVTRRAIRILADCCSASPLAEKQRIRLLQLCSREGSDLFEKCVRGTSLTLFDLLCSFPGCDIPLARLLELLPRLQPRPYTLICFDENAPDRQLLRFIFTRVDFPIPAVESVSGLVRYSDRHHGTCTGWLDRLWTENVQPRTVRLYLRRNLNGFYLPDSMHRPLIMIGAGAGLAPFLIFLEHYKRSRDGTEPVSTWLIYGCRSPRTSLIMSEKLDDALSNGTLGRCCLCFSRYTLNPENPELPENVPSDLSRRACLHVGVTHVQDCIFPAGSNTALTSHQQSLAEWVVHRNAVVMVCGEAKNMGQAVALAWEKLIAAYIGQTSCDRVEMGLSHNESFLKQMRMNGRYLEDLWA